MHSRQNTRRFWLFHRSFHTYCPKDRFGTHHLAQMGFDMLVSGPLTRRLSAGRIANEYGQDDVRHQDVWSKSGPRFDMSATASVVPAFILWFPTLEILRQIPSSFRQHCSAAGFGRRLHAAQAAGSSVDRRSGSKGEIVRIAIPGHAPSQGVGLASLQIPLVHNVLPTLYVELITRHVLRSLYSVRMHIRPWIGRGLILLDWQDPFGYSGGSAPCAPSVRRIVQLLRRYLVTRQAGGAAKHHCSDSIFVVGGGTPQPCLSE